MILLPGQQGGTGGEGIIIPDPGEIFRLRQSTTPAIWENPQIPTMPVLGATRAPYRKSCRGINGRGPGEAGEVPVYAAGYSLKKPQGKFDPGASLKGSVGGNRPLVVMPYVVRRRPERRSSGRSQTKGKLSDEVAYLIVFLFISF